MRCPDQRIDVRFGRTGRHASSGREDQTAALFEITPETLSFHTIDRTFAVEPGEFEPMIRTSSCEEHLRRLAPRVE